MKTTGVLATLAAPALAAYKGFNYGALDLSGATRNQASFETEFNVAKNLAGTNGAFTSARLYTSLQGTSTAPIEAIAAAVNTETSLLLGIWISGNPNVDNEVNAIKAAIDAHGSAFTDLVAGISVGNEDVYRITDLGIASNAGPGVTPQGVADYVNQVRSGLAGTALEGKPIGHVDTYNTFSNSSGWMAPVIEAVDFIGMNGFPYFEDTKPNGIENGNATFWGDYDAVVGQAGDKEIWVTETGWPSSGPQSGAATPSVANAETYFGEVYCSLVARGINVWWYTLEDSTADASVPSFGVAEGGSPKYDLSC
ncbi:uncharacterized protein HMPREF1541_06598 [Cyphellophora europaea CBS 101466]|uniref:Probable glucan endo-1,3-beta-glucosidase eglC n=1 Tax=Cyphellophora europaea (strain CBS 101466) TaxID=1220924 RepID=W2RQ13_CYPE1|nr:uncharacterized protein HMPREF1541_06598 [Cyphellophora europaea CBS 101466]ETN38562.1 hypothetical protein HMPREF1541_06598 [Cyphellophora europaea CBS 101466]